MEIEMRDIDDILRSCGVENSSTPPPQPEEPVVASTESNISITEDDVNSILEENGYSESTVEEEDNGILDPEFEDTEENEEAPSDSLHQAEEEFHEALEEYTSNNITLTRVSAEVLNDERVTVPPEDVNITQSINSSSSNNEDAKIPLNSPTLLLDDTTSRFSGAEWYQAIQNTNIILAGLGGIGSNAALQIARMVPAKLILYDDDNVELANMAGQLYSYSDFGKTKVDAIADMISLYTSMTRVQAIAQKFTKFTEPGDIMICGFDNMMARKTFFYSWKRHIEGKSMEERAKCLYIDGRLSMDCLQVLCIKGDDEYNIDRYSKEFLFSDADADATVCSMKQTTYLACMIGSIITNLFTNFVAGTLNPIIPYDLPFFTEYDAQNMIFKTES